MGFPVPDICNLLAQGTGGLGGLFMTGNNKPFQVSTEGMARAARLLGLDEPDQDPPHEFSGHKQRQGPPQPCDVPAGIFHFGCR